MRKKNGFVFMETIVVVSALSLTLIILFASYSYILRKSRERNTFDTTETIYKTYYIKQIIDSLKPLSETRSGVKYYIDTHTNICSQMKSYNSYECDLSSSDYNGDLIQIKKSFEVDKFYLLTPREILTSANKNAWLNEFDATTIDYINDLGESIDYPILVIKYKKYFNKPNGEYETLHSSVEVTT